MGALIAIGGGNDALAAIATAAARRIGPVDVDHGDTCCESPKPVPYIAKIRAHKEAKAARKALKV